MFNEIDGNFDDIAIRTFKVGLPVEHDLRKSLTRKPVRSGGQARLGAQIDVSTRPPLGTIIVILIALRRTGSQPSRVMSIAHRSTGDSPPNSKRGRLEARLALSFSDKDKVGTLQPHDDALVVTLKIGVYDVKRVLVDQGSGVEIMYPDLFKRLKLRPEDLACYNSPLIEFDRKIVFSKVQIRLPVQAGSEVMEVNFIVVDTYSPYTAIVARHWLHAMGAVSSTLHLKVKYPSGDWVEELVGSQFMAK
ncbi:uncharacterized protein LOC115950013 [Quercus lobata]|uniref:uncharacterized protein LOC115950013 n=1 Tax=Quercus lobata TaxID=97700 RepID=UPI00124770D4|nr:uncharacterized protein LOC115950013 [Quercus lobata]